MDTPQKETITIEMVSWSQLQTFLQCPRKWELGYVDNLERIPSADSLARVRGAAFHAGIQAAFLSPEGQTEAAIQAARNYLIQNTERNKEIWDYSMRVFVPDVAYYAMLDTLAQELPSLLAYHVPHVGIGTRYRAATHAEVFGGSDDTPMLEYHFVCPVGQVGVQGYVDAVLIDIETGVQVICDWKLRTQFTPNDATQADGQLTAYAALLNAQGANIQKSIQWQFRAKTPTAASISKRDGKPNTGAQSYDTTWEEWVRTLPADINPERYRELMEPKLKTLDEFQLRGETAITTLSCALARANIESAMTLLSFAATMLNEGSALPAVLSAQQCRYCDFVKLCADPLKHGGNADILIQSEFREKTKHEHIEESRRTGNNQNDPSYWRAVFGKNKPSHSRVT